MIDVSHIIPMLALFVALILTGVLIGKAKREPTLPSTEYDPTLHDFRDPKHAEIRRLLRLIHSQCPGPISDSDADDSPEEDVDDPERGTR